MSLTVADKLKVLAVLAEESNWTLGEPAERLELDEDLIEAWADEVLGRNWDFILKEDEPEALSTLISSVAAEVTCETSLLRAGRNAQLNRLRGALDAALTSTLKHTNGTANFVRAFKAAEEHLADGDMPEWKND